ncbi:hypothetical protein ZWY2020_030631 [Hordeum vulgare]|nr:hypothetical protein ZWY2020_030631 [Hordeum vulgare]
MSRPASKSGAGWKRRRALAFLVLVRCIGGQLPLSRFYVHRTPILLIDNPRSYFCSINKVYHFKHQDELYLLSNKLVVKL